ncbi:hypothetical protein KST26_01920 [Fusobacterium animalis]|uniref:hypothetical protein n=1 Tax=Fusobacterium animalis TaxID=76859 RepID=UPI0030CFC8E7
MTKKIENFIDNVIEEKKEQFKTMMGKEQRVENMIEDLKALNLSNEKLEEVIKVVKKYV